MWSISKTDYCADRSILALPFAYQEYLPTFKLVTSQVVQWARPLSGLIWLLGREKVKSKDKEESGKVYIRRLQVAPSPACVLASDRQVQDVKRFCANTTNQFSILSIDTTFNIGDFYLTPTTYRHLLREDRRTGKPPCYLGQHQYTPGRTATLSTTLEQHSQDLTTKRRTYDL